MDALHIDVDIAQTELVVETNVTTTEKTIEIDIGSSDYQVYRGETDVVPMAWEDQTLQTANKVVRRDIHIAKVPKWETSNQQGGYTVYIADNA